MGEKELLLFANDLDPTPSKIMAAPYVVVGDSLRAETPKVCSSNSVQKATRAHLAKIAPGKK